MTHGLQPQQLTIKPQLRVIDYFPPTHADHCSCIATTLNLHQYYLYLHCLLHYTPNTHIPSPTLQTTYTAYTTYTTYYITHTIHLYRPLHYRQPTPPTLPTLTTTSHTQYINTRHISPQHYTTTNSANTPNTTTLQPSHTIHRLATITTPHHHHHHQDTTVFCNIMWQNTASYNILHTVYSSTTNTIYQY